MDIIYLTNRKKGNTVIHLFYRHAWMTLIENVTVDVDVEETAGVTKQQDMHQIQTFIFYTSLPLACTCRQLRRSDRDDFSRYKIEHGLYTYCNTERILQTK